MKKLAFVSDAIYPYNKGGKETRLYEITTRLAQRGYDVHIYTMHWWSTQEKERTENGVHLHAISPYYPLYAGERRSFKEAILFGLACFAMIRENWDFIEVDHMPHFPLFSMKLVCLLKRKKMHVVWHEVWGLAYWKKYLGTAGYLAFLIEYFSVRTADKLISISEHTTEKLGSLLGITKNITNIPLGIDLSKTGRINPSENQYDVIFAGRLLSHKNVPLLIHAINELKKEIPQIQCLIVGEGPEKSSLKEQSQKLNLEDTIHFSDFKEKIEDLYSLIKSSKVFAFPSEREGFGSIAAESMSLGTPVVTLDHESNASRQFIQPQLNGLLASNTYTSLAQSLKKALYTAWDKNIITQSIAKYDWNAVISSYCLEL